MTTALSVITRAMQKIGALTKNETPSSDEANDALETLNDLISSWSNDSSKIYARVTESFTLTPADGEYTIGPSGNFNTAWPIKILQAYTRSGTVDTHLKILSEENYSLLTIKSQPGPVDCLTYTPGYPLGTIKLWPIPSAADSLFILSEKELASLATLGTDISFPPGWKRALIYNLAIDLSPEYGQPVTEEVAEIARDSKASIMRAAIKNRPLDVPGYSNTNNIFTGWS